MYLNPQQWPSPICFIVASYQADIKNAFNDLAKCQKLLILFEIQSCIMHSANVISESIYPLQS